MRGFFQSDMHFRANLSTANQCYQQAAELSAELQDYQRSMELYQTVADWSLTSALTKYSVKEYWLRAALCSMAMGVSISCQNQSHKCAY